jgi:hypothetical protein
VYFKDLFLECKMEATNILFETLQNTRNSSNKVFKKLNKKRFIKNCLGGVQTKRRNKWM